MTPGATVDKKVTVVNTGNIASLAQVSFSGSINYTTKEATLVSAVDKTFLEAHAADEIAVANITGFMGMVH